MLTRGAFCVYPVSERLTAAYVFPKLKLQFFFVNAVIFQ